MTVFEIGMCIGFVGGILTYHVMYKLVAMLCPGAFGVSRGVYATFHSPVSLGHWGGVTVNGTTISGDTFDGSCTKSLRIIADGEVLNHHAQPGTPIYLTPSPGVVFETLAVDESLTVDGSLERVDNLTVQGDCVVKAALNANAVVVHGDVRAQQCLTCTTAKAHGNIGVDGDMYSDVCKAKGTIKVRGNTRRRRDSLYG